MRINPRAPRLAMRALAAVLLLPPVAAHAADDPPLPRSMRLEYLTPKGPLGKGCPGPEEFQNLVVTDASRNPFNKDATALLWVSISRSRGRYEVTFELRDAAGVAVYTEPVEPRISCGSLVENLAFQIGDRLKDRPPPEPLTASTTTTTTTPTTTPETATTTTTTKETTKETSKITSTTTKEKKTTTPAKTTSTTPPATAPLLWALRGAVTGGVGLGVSPAPAAGVFILELGGQRKLSPKVMFSGTLGVLWSPHRSALESVEMSSTQVEVGTTLVTGVAAPCVHARIGFPWIFGCVGLELGGLRGDGAKIPYPASAVSLWAALDPRLGIEVPLTSRPSPRVPQFAVRAFGDMPVLLHRPKALVGEGPSMSSGRITPVWTPPLVASAFHFGILVWHDVF